MARIFLSHSWKNDRELALRLRDALNRRGHTVFVDTEILDYGTEWGIGLLNALMNADGVIALLTETSMQSQFELTVDEISKAVVSHGNRTRVSSNMPRLFISHRHMDEKIAGALAECVRTRFSIEIHDIRCTSVYPYRLKAGEDTERKLREEVVQAEAVLGLISPTANQSTFVMFELGAAWGRNTYTCPLLIKSATSDDLPDPIRNRHPLDLRKPRDCLQLLDDLQIGTTLQRRDGPGVDGEVMAKVEALVQAAAAV